MLSAFLLIGRQAPTQYVDENSWGMYNILQLHQRQLSALRQLDASPYILIVGGSSSVFGIDATMLSRRLQRPVFNLGANGLMGGDYILYNAMRLARPGDTIVLMLEYEVLPPARPTEARARYILAWDRAYLMQSSWSNIAAHFGSISLSGYRDTLLEAFAGTPRTDLLDQPFRISAHGTLLYNLPENQSRQQLQALRSTPSFQAPPNPDLQSIKAGLIALKADADQRGIKLLAGFPPRLDTPGYHTPEALAFQSSIQTMYTEAGIQTLGQPTGSLFPINLFFDTHYHLNTNGAAIMTARLGDLMAKLLPRPATAPEEKRLGSFSLSMSGQYLPLPVDSMRGISFAEPPLGRWTNGAATITFISALPNRFDLVLDISLVHGNNARAAARVQVGAKSRPLEMLMPGPGSHCLTLENPGNENSLVISPPHPEKPSPGDNRHLGYMIRRIGITPLAPAKPGCTSRAMSVATGA